MEDDFKIIQSYLGVYTSKECTNENVKNALSMLKTVISKNKNTNIDGNTVYDIVDDSAVFPQLTQENKPMTKWQKFAKDKGIVKKKTSRRVFCEETQEWEYKYGSKSINNQKMASGIVEGKKSINQLKREKQARVKKNKTQQLKNKERIAKGNIKKFNQ